MKFIDLSEFMQLGYLQEVNRQFFHPLGMALTVALDADDVPHLWGVQDYRDDPEGIIFAEGVLNPEKAARVEAEATARRAVREELAGYWIQPVPEVK